MRWLWFAILNGFWLLTWQSVSTHAQVSDTAPLVGSIAYVDVDGDIVVIDGSDFSHTGLTDDAGSSRRYQWPTWSTDNRLAYFAVAIEDSQQVTQAYITSPTLSDAILAYTGLETFNYAYWSPGNCPITTSCRDLAILLSSPARGMFVELVRAGLDPTVSLTAGVGGPPFYYTWSADGSQMLWQRNNERFDVYDAVNDVIVSTLDQTPGAIFAPAWSPVDKRLLVGIMNDTQSTDLAIVDAESGTATILAEDFGGFVAFNWSPDGTQVAYREATTNGFGPLYVVNDQGEQLVRSPGTGVIAFFWSPDSQKIAYLTLASPPGTFSASNLLAQGTRESVGLAWSVMDVSTGDVVQYGQFFPTRELVYMMQFFDQFAQSHRLWSPDSSHLVYGDIMDTGPVIKLLDTTRIDSVPTTIAEGLIGIWSFN